MSESPYQTIAVASAFSPRFLQVLAEAGRMRERFGATLHAVYAGERTPETDAQFGAAFAQLAMPVAPSVIHAAGEPASVILGAVRTHGIDLLIAGALEKEVVLRPFLGNIARRLVREADCSVMLFTKPSECPQPLRRIVFVTDYSATAQRAFQQTLYLAERENCERLHVIRSYTTFDAARATLAETGVASPAQPAARTIEQEEAAIEEFIDAAGPTPVPMEARCVRGNTGFAVSDFVQNVEADLLVLPAERAAAGSAVSRQMDWATEVIPCNLWVIR